jgi:hypothetical protein
MIKKKGNHNQFNNQLKAVTAVRLKGQSTTKIAALTKPVTVLRRVSSKWKRAFQKNIKMNHQQVCLRITTNFLEAKIQALWENLLPLPLRRSKPSLYNKTKTKVKIVSVMNNQNSHRTSLLLQLNR